MPLYEYRCGECGAKFELLRPMSQADAMATCPFCGSTETRRALSLFAARSRSEGGTTRSIAGSSCSGCTATTCTGCTH